MDKLETQECVEWFVAAVLDIVAVIFDVENVRNQIKMQMIIIARMYVIIAMICQKGIINVVVALEVPDVEWNTKYGSLLMLYIDDIMI